MFLLPKILRIIACAFSIIALLTVSACGSGGESEVKTEDTTVAPAGDSSGDTDSEADDNDDSGDGDTEDTTDGDGDDSSDDGGTNDDVVGGGDGTADDQSLYVVLQVRTHDAGLSSVSNRISKPSGPGDQISLQWSDPTRTITSGCLTQSDIQGYMLRYGTDENSYSVSQEISKVDDTQLICQATPSVDGSCGTVYQCEYSLEVAENISA